MSEEEEYEYFWEYNSFWNVYELSLRFKKDQERSDQKVKSNDR